MNPCTLWMDAAAGHILFATLTVAWTLWLAVWVARCLTRWLTDHLVKHLFGGF